MVTRGPREGGGIPDNRGGKAAGRKDNAEEVGEYVEQQAWMRWLSNEKHAANEAESRLWAERDATKRDMRQDRIGRLRSTKEMVVRERSGIRRDDNDIFLYLALCAVLLDLALLGLSLVGVIE